MRGVLRRKERALSQEEALQIIRDAEYGVLATASKEGVPSTTALNHALLDDGCLYFHSSIEGEKIANIRENPQVSYFVAGPAQVVFSQFSTVFSSAVVHGTMTEIKDIDPKLEALQKIAAYFSDGTVSQKQVQEYIDTYLPKVAVLKLTPEHITGKARLSG